MSKDINDSQATTSIDLRNGNLRYLGYSHIIGDIIQRWLSRTAWNITYATTGVYILADIISQCKTTCEDGCGRKTFIKAGDVFNWQSIATIFVPQLITNGIKFGTAYGLMKTAAPSTILRLNLPIALSLLSIPIIIQPIDRFADYLMDQTYRKYIV